MLSPMARAARMLVLVLAACGSGDAKKQVRDHAPRVAPADQRFAMTILGEPVRSARAWTMALVPNARGGWNFITQTYEYPSNNPTEFVVLDLATGKQTITEGPPGIYANSNYQLAEQLRAPNGRVFFPMLENHIAYYDPVDETVKMLGKIAPGDDKLIYRMVFGPDGKLYGGTQSNGLPLVFVLDPDTLKVTELGRVGENRNGYSYAYYLAPDPPWLYVAVGESPWELVAVNMKTGQRQVLATRADEGFMQFAPGADGITATLVSGLRTPRQRKDEAWVVDGKLHPFSPAGKRPFKPRKVKPPDAVLYGAPEIDTSNVNPSSDGIGRVRWRADRNAAWRDVPFQVKHTVPVEIEALAALPDGSVLGNAQQYHGFFRYDPKADTFTRLASIEISGGARATVDHTTYLAGYPNAVLFAYDTRKPWSPGTNPQRLGNFAQTGTHYAYALVPSRNGRLYYAGRRERTGTGGGVGFYDRERRTFAGHHDRLDRLDPQGLVVLDDLQRVVYSGRVIGDPSAGAAPAQLVVFDANLVEVERMTVRDDLRATGVLYRQDKSVVVGVVAEHRAMYRYDVAKGALLAWRELPGNVTASAQRADGSLWLVVDNVLYRVDPRTFTEKRIGAVPETTSGAGSLVWQGDRLYWAVGYQLREITAPLSE